MAGQPKNKITRAEQGKRRRGNTPHLLKNLKQASTPLHKRALYARISSLLTTKGLAQAKKAVQTKDAAESTSKSSAVSNPANLVKNTASSAKTVTPIKRVPQTQHKGG